MCTEFTGCIRSVGCKATPDLSELVFLLDNRSPTKTNSPSSCQTKRKWGRAMFRVVDTGLCTGRLIKGCNGGLQCQVWYQSFVLQRQVGFRRRVVCLEPQLDLATFIRVPISTNHRVQHLLLRD